MSISCFTFVFFKQKTAYEMRISDWSSDVCSSDLRGITLAFNTVAGDTEGIETAFARHHAQRIAGQARQRTHVLSDIGGLGRLDRRLPGRHHAMPAQIGRAHV